MHSLLKMVLAANILQINKNIFSPIKLNDRKSSFAEAINYIVLKEQSWPYRAR